MSNSTEGVLVKTMDKAVEPQHEKNYQDWLDAGFVPIAGGALESNIMGIWFSRQKEKGVFVRNAASKTFKAKTNSNTKLTEIGKSEAEAADLAVGAEITGTGIPAGTKVKSFTIAESSEVVLTKAAVASASGVEMTIKNAWTKRGRWVGGDLQVARTDGEEAWSDQTLFSAHVDFVNTYLGNGAPVVQGQSSMITYLGSLAFGKQEVSVAAKTAEFELKGTENAAEEGVWTLEITVEGNTVKYSTPKILKTATCKEVMELWEEYFPGWFENIECTEGSAVKMEKLGTEKAKFKFKNELANQPFKPETVLIATGFSGTPPTTKSIEEGKLAKWIITPEETGGPWFGILKEVGKSTTYRAQFNDCRVQSLRIEGSSASKVVKLTPTVLSLNPGEIAREAPTQKDDGLKPWLFTEAHGHLTIDGISYHGQSQFAFLFSWGLNEYYGDQVHPFDLINNIATASIEGLTLLIDEAGIKRYYQQIYGTETPSAGAKPLEILPLLGSYKAEFTRTSPYTSGLAETLKLEMFGVKWSANLNIPANPAGGPVELSFTGAMRKEPGQGYTAGAGKKTRAEVEPKPFQITVEQFKDTEIYAV